MALLDKSKFLDTDSYEYRDIYIKELDGEIRIKALSISAQISFEEEATRDNIDQSELMFHLILGCCVDDKGELLFTLEDVKTLKQKSANVIMFLFKEILKINNINQDEVDQLAKN